MVQLRLCIGKQKLVSWCLTSASRFRLDFLCRRCAEKDELLQFVSLGEPACAIPGRVPSTTDAGLSSDSKTVHYWQPTTCHVSYRRSRWPNDYGFGHAHARGASLVPPLQLPY